MIVPPPLVENDRIAIVSPASEVKPEYIDGAAAFLRGKGFEPVVFPHAKGPVDGSFASGIAGRLSDMHMALVDKEIKAILCARGGYGCVHLLDGIPIREIADNPKWLVGFSDISALHALWQKAGVASLHAPMAKHLTLQPWHPATCEILRILRGDTRFEYRVVPSSFNRRGTARGKLIGGNLAVLNGLASTPYDILDKDFAKNSILFIEDISEAIYAVERMLERLWLAGTFNSISGLVVGQFTEYRPDRNHPSMESMISTFLDKRGIGLPVAFGFPAGHVDDNYPLIEGAEVELTVNPGGSILKTVELWKTRER